MTINTDRPFQISSTSSYIQRAQTTKTKNLVIPEGDLLLAVAVAFALAVAFVPPKNLMA